MTCASGWGVQWPGICAKVNVRTNEEIRGMQSNCILSNSFLQEGRNRCMLNAENMPPALNLLRKASADNWVRGAEGLQPRDAAPFRSRPADFSMFFQFLSPF